MAQILEENRSNAVENHDINFALEDKDKLKEKIPLRITIDEISELFSAST
ncbi:4805_t:CDS:1, partial [Acaulospora morrowiae]